MQLGKASCWKMQKCIYPKIYARIEDIILVDNSRYIVDNGRCIHPPIQPIYIFITDDDQKIVARYPRRCGSTPRRIRLKRWNSKNQFSRSYLIGERVKLYQRPQDNGRWSYRYSGE